MPPCTSPIRRWSLILAVMGGTMAMPASQAQTSGACGPEGQAARVVAVEPGLELRLADGRRVSLAGIDPPRATPDRPDLGEAARKILASWLEGRDILLRPLATTADRWNRLPALVFAATGPAGEAGSPVESPRLSVAEALLDAGWARAKPDNAVHGCYPIFLGLEAQARLSGLGLWADPFYAVLQAEDRTALAARTGGMVVVEGVVRLRSGRFRTYVALAHGFAALAATTSPRIIKLLGKAGLDLQGLVGKKVRLRGYLDDRFGLRIDLTLVDQIEILSIEPPMPDRSKALEDTRGDGESAVPEAARPKL